MYMLLLKEVGVQLELARKLENIPYVKLHNSPHEPESWRIAHDLSQIEESFDVIFSRLVPQLMRESNQEQIQELLQDIGDQIRHASYHINNSAYLRSWASDLPSGD
jgi:uncharacterized protein Yka (UPF0111/DUF47 family)